MYASAAMAETSTTAMSVEECARDYALYLAAISMLRTQPLEYSARRQASRCRSDF